MDFDFNKVHKIMYLLDWKWATINRVPTAKELEEESSKMIDRLFEEGYTKIRHGGLVAELEDEEGVKLLKLEFILEAGQGGRYL